MKQISILLILMTPWLMFSQKPNKTLHDTIFHKGDIIRLPEIVYWGGCLCRLDPKSTNEDSLAAIAGFLKRFPKYTFRIEAHSDTRGSKKNNKILTNIRAKDLRDYLFYYHRIDTINVSATGLGLDFPLIKNEEIRKLSSKEEKEKMHQKNRRVQLVVTGQK